MEVILLLSRSRKSFIVLPIIVSAFCFYSVEFADEGPAQTLAKALLCFNNKFIYNKCSEAYRLNQSGDLGVPPEATDEFCNGACLSETQGLLSCIDNIVPSFLFNKKATTRDIEGTLQSACSYTKQTGNFNVGEYIQRATSDLLGIPKPATIHALALLITGCFLMLM